MASFQSVEDPIPECTAASGSSIFSISTMDGRLEYIDEGTHSSLPPLLFLHGYLADAESFRGVLDYMTLHGYRVIALDFPGYGYNRHLAPLSSMNGWVDYVFNFLSSLNLQSCILVGHSLGGMVAQQFAVSHPNYCSKLILSGTSCIGRIPCRFETLEESIDRFHKLGFVSTAHEIVKRGFQSNLTETYRLSHLAFGAVSRTSLEAVEASFRGMLNWGDTGRANLDADLIRVPTLILWGDKDSTIERTLANRLEESIRSSYLSVLPQTGHFSHLEIPSIIGENILCFLHDQPVPQYRFEFFSAAEIALCLDDDRCVSKRLLETLPPRDQRQQAVYRLTCGLVHFLKSGNKRVEKFGEIKRAADLQEHKLRHYRQLQNLLSEKDRAQFIQDWNPEEFYLAMQEVKQKRANLLPEVARELDFQPFIKNRAFKYDTSMVIPEDLQSSSTLRMKLPTCPLSFDPYFLRRVHACLLSVARPEDIFDVEHIQSVDSTDTLFTRIQNFKEREICQNCGTKCYLYCADCGGLRMPKASQVLPSRINLEHFNILIVLHWQEKVSKSTGVAAAVMALEGQVKIVNWPRSEREWAHDYLEYKDKMAKQVDVVLDEINCESDYLLFPGAGSVDAASVDWSTVPLDMAVKSSDEASLQAPSMPRKRRLIVIESSWATGKTVYNDLLLGLNAKYGPEMASKLKCISLSNIVGQYWRFQAVGHSAVSTIEAIYHAAMVAKNCSREMTAEQASVPSKSVQCSDANNVNEAKTSESTVSCDEPYDALLILFRLQRNRILTDLRSKDRGLPRAMRVSGSGIGDWAIVLNSYGMSLKGQVDD